MKKTIGVLCTIIFLASMGWKLTQALMTIKSESNLVEIGYLRVSDGSVLEFKTEQLPASRAQEVTVLRVP